MRNLRCLAALLVLLLAMPTVAQETTSSIQGTVTDQTGAALPGVSVEALNTRGQRFTATTDSSGTYRFPALPPGTYTITATLAGMAAAPVRNYELTLGMAPRIDLRMRLAALTEAVTVTAEAPIVDVTRSAVTTSVTRQQIETLPR
ncbi:MAG TPA: carboxypeptidase-like regulatory domain-containing protein, partial [Thermoanaerobaculia bacterium]|nr:carboxypeptidase-like regulatory domain-containing protein [Thermoanaerobaculia bacterium]